MDNASRPRRVEEATAQMRRAIASRRRGPVARVAWPMARGRAPRAFTAKAAQWAFAALVALGGPSVGCSGELPSPSVIDKLRLLAITADAPEVMPGSSVTLAAVWADAPARAGREVYFLWRLCPQGNDTDARVCLDPARGTDVRTAAASAGGAALTLGPDALALPDGQHEAGYFVLLAVCPAQPPVFDAGAGQYACPSEVSVPEADREGIQAVRRLSVRDAVSVAQSGPLNHNPVIASLSIAGQDVPTDGAVVHVAPCPSAPDPSGAPCPSVPVVLRAAEGSAETTANGTPEALLVSFFAPYGTFDRPRALPSDGAPLGQDGALMAGWTPPVMAQRFAMYVVLRDGRGGDVVRSATVVVGP
jgi:hypothetical protein